MLWREWCNFTGIGSQCHWLRTSKTSETCLVVPGTRNLVYTASDVRAQDSQRLETVGRPAKEKYKPDSKPEARHIHRRNGSCSILVLCHKSVLNFVLDLVLIWVWILDVDLNGIGGCYALRACFDFRGVGCH